MNDLARAQIPLFLLALFLSAGRAIKTRDIFYANWIEPTFLTPFYRDVHIHTSTQYQCT